MTPAATRAREIVGPHDPPAHDQPEEWCWVCRALHDGLVERIAAALAELDAALAEARRELQQCRLTRDGFWIRQKQEQARADAAEAALAEARRHGDLAKRLVNRLPLCQDHRDKFGPEECQACRAEYAETRLTAVRKRDAEARQALEAWCARDARSIYEPDKSQTKCICDWASDRAAMLRSEHSKVCTLVRAALGCPRPAPATLAPLPPQEREGEG